VEQAGFRGTCVARALRFVCSMRSARRWYLAIFLAALLAPQAPAGAPPRRLVICVDGVGYDTFAKMRAEGRFRCFAATRPARMIAPFPSLTDVSMTEVLRPAGAGEANGYEDSYFDWETNRIRGGLLDRFRQDKFVESGFRRLFDYHPSAVASGLAFAVPPVSAYLETLSEIAQVRRKFRATSGPVCLVYIGGTDTLAHLGGERMLRSALARLDAAVTKIVAESGGAVEVSIFSDHGNAFGKHRRVSVAPALKRAGFRPTKSLRHDGDRDVVVPRFGLVAAAAVYTREENEPEVAGVCARVPGVQFAAYESDGAVTVVARDGRARVERRRDRYRYVAEAGDPLALSDEAARLAAEGKTDDDGFAADRDWFAATREGPFPDAVRRVYEGLTSHVRNRASVLVSFEDGFYAGSPMLDLFAPMRAAHGNLGSGESLGFVASTSRDLPPYLRASEVWSSVVSSQ
jgi:hypothetical protein